jgi:hypothetical protein
MDRPGILYGVKYNVVSFTLQNKYKVEGYINEQNMVERVRTWVDNDVQGDMPVEAIYREYKDFGGVKAPKFVIVNQGGFATSILVVMDAKANVPMTTPSAPAQACSAASHSSTCPAVAACLSLTKISTRFVRLPEPLAPGSLLAVSWALPMSKGNLLKSSDRPMCHGNGRPSTSSRVLGRDPVVGESQTPCTTASMAPSRERIASKPGL